MRKNRDAELLLCAGAIACAVWILCSIGLLILNSAGSGMKDPYSFVTKQICYLIVALFALGITTFIDLQKLKKLSKPIAIVSIIALILVLIPHVGKEVNGSRRWLELGIISVQASDFAKIALIITLASFLHDNQRQLTTFTTGILKPIGLISMFVAFIIVEPDFGTSALCFGVGVTMMYLSGCNWKILASAAGIGVTLLSVALYFNPNRRARLLAFMDVENTKLEGSYQLYQAILGFGTGGIEGQGIGNGRQQLSFLPEAHTDFIFAIVGEELGLVFTCLVAIMFAVIFFAGIRALRKANNRFELYLATGAIFMICYQAMFNMCVVTGLMPTKGISLPFISYGGSNLVVMFIFIGIIFNCIRRWKKPTEIKVVEFEI